MARAPEAKGAARAHRRMRVCTGVERSPSTARHSRHDMPQLIPPSCCMRWTRRTRCQEGDDGYHAQVKLWSLVILLHCTFPPSIVISDLGFGHGLIVSRSNCRSMSEFASMPVRGSALAAGYDISASHACTIPARGKNLVKTDLQMAIPEGCYGRIAPRSGLAWKNFIDTGAGVIDADTAARSR